MKKEKLFTISNVTTALVLMLFFISVSVCISLNFRPLYYFDMENLNISGNTGMSNEEIKQNYDALIDYNSVFNNGELEFPTLSQSETGKIHFAEVKNIFVIFQVMSAVTFVLSCVMIIIKSRKKSFLYLKLAAIFSVAVPVFVGACIAVGWETFFVTFHKIVFNNSYWVFDPRYDPVINILPNEYFMHAAILIIALVLLLALLSYIIYKLLISRGKDCKNSL